MSSDLLKEFGTVEGDQSNWSSGHDVAAETRAEEEDFGDFEGPPNVSGDTRASSSESTVFTLEKSRADKTTLASDSVPTQGLHLSSNALLPGLPTNGKPSTRTVFGSSTVSQAPSGNDDEWGDFVEDSVIFDAQMATMKNSPPSSEFSISQLEAYNNPKTSQDRRVPMNPASAANITSTKSESSSRAPIATDLGPPPSNIPPPSTLLSLIPALFQSLPVSVKDIPTLDRTFPDLHKTIEQPQIDSIQELLATARAAARIIAGRKLRWKRDTLLSQSMKIGPASGGKSGGMKLTGIDKTESRREDQEVAEVLRVWKQIVGPLRTLVATLNAQLPGSGLRVSEMSENIPVRLGQMNEGTVSARRCCFLCGIKRDERVEKVDVAVEDSFGEYWAEHWGHVECIKFWNNHRHLLGQR